MANLPPSHYPDIGHLGEDLVAQWLESTDWVILHRRFSCRWGEIDIIAQHHDCNSQKDAINPISTQYSTLAFVEVKTRSSGNWDAGGRSAITLQKQIKLSRTAEIFLAEYPLMADCACRFDVAIVYCQRISKQRPQITSASQALVSASVAGYQFYLQEYLPAAFDAAMDS